MLEWLSEQIFLMSAARKDIKDEFSRRAFISGKCTSLDFQLVHKSREKFFPFFDVGRMRNLPQATEKAYYPTRTLSDDKIAVFPLRGLANLNLSKENDDKEPSGRSAGKRCMVEEWGLPS
ncbi:hypothetical protein CDAR_91481 [Caerostris darwini]|uniref:Uncharacterized protein n=1 Tax=Caerostris darwini TaxID=1538125 RepID=A0AAV4WFW1_9ARAC|nr:hypothetical protein CDAR_91481 [Caerostris darwini]